MGLILVDSSVWIDLFADKNTPQTATLGHLLAQKRAITIGDLVLVEVLQGTRSEQQAIATRAFFDEFIPMKIVGARVAVEAARNYRTLRALGITPRKTIDTLIATRCILDRIPLLYSDRDFDPFVQHLGLISALDASGVN